VWTKVKVFVRENMTLFFPFCLRPRLFWKFSGGRCTVRAGPRHGALSRLLIRRLFIQIFFKHISDRIGETSWRRVPKLLIIFGEFLSPVESLALCFQWRRVEICRLAPGWSALFSVPWAQSEVAQPDIKNRKHGDDDWVWSCSLQV
jgi:hypothetical protein